jgi:hypothetical protein
MWCDRFAVLLLAGLLGASPGPTFAVVTTCMEPAEFGFAEAAPPASAIDGDVVGGVDAAAKSLGRPASPAMSRAVATAPALAFAHCDPPDAHAGRAPPRG